MATVAKKIYISFSQSDVDIVRRIAQGLEAKGYECYYGENVAHPGEDWNKALADRLREADLALIIISKAAVDSGYVMAEAGAALAYSRHRGGALSIVPVRIDSTPVPGALHSVAAILAQGGDVDHIVNQVQRTIGAFEAENRARVDAKREVQSRISETAGNYIQDSLGRLRTQESRDRRTAYIWYSVAFVALIVAVAFPLYRMLMLDPVRSPPWQVLVELFGLDVVAVGMAIALSKFAFTLGKSFMVESVRNADRIHAMSFGDFYLHAFGEKAEWVDLKEAFQHWNVDRGSAFATQEAGELTRSS